MNKQEQLIKFGTVLKSRRQSLNLSLRDVEKLSNVSAALITKLENGKMAYIGAKIQPSVPYYYITR